MKEFDMAKYTCLEDDCGIKPSKRMRCASCKRHIWKTSTSLPEGEATCRQCRRGNRRRNTGNTCIECGRSWTGQIRPTGLCETCTKNKTEAERARDGKLCQAPGCDRGAYSLTRMLCNSHAASDSHNKRQVQNTCRGCGQTFTSRDKQLYCAIQCRNTNRDPLDYERSAHTRATRTYPYTCKICGAEGNGHLGRTVCDDTMCQYLGNNGRVSCPWYYKTCAWCDEPFTTDREAQIYCTTKCSEALKTSMNGRKPRPYRRYAQLVYKRDNYTCHLCGQPTLKAWDENNRALSPTLDHIIPKSMGGPDTPDNLATACFECNVRRGVKDAEVYRQSLLTLV